jgi:hypothetical protein
MAVNTQDERRALIDYGLPFGSSPLADGHIGAADRRQLVGLYPGLSVTPLQPEPEWTFVIQAEQRVWKVTR